MLAGFRVMKRQAESADKRDIIFQYGSDTFWIKNKTGTLKVEVGWEQRMCSFSTAGILTGSSLKQAELAYTLN
jgi:hypothetical protein